MYLKIISNYLKAVISDPNKCAVMVYIVVDIEFYSRPRTSFSMCSVQSIVYHPWMTHNFTDCQPVVDISIKHPSDKVDAIFRERQERNPKRMVQDFIDIVEWVFLVDDSIEKNAKGPNILLLAPVRFALEDFRSSIIY